LSWVCHSDWKEQIVVVAADAEEPDDMELDTVELDAMDPDAGLKI